MAKWFTLVDEKIEGPFTTDQLLRRAEAQELSKDLLIWGALQSGWKPISWWQQSLPHFKSIESEMNQPEMWFMVETGRKTGPFLRNEIVGKLKACVDSGGEISKILLWTKGQKKWANITEFHDLMNEVGLDKRVHPRAQISGQVTIQFQGQSFISGLRTVSEGGVGIDPIPMVAAGEEIQLELESKHFSNPVKAKAEVRYSSERSMGLKFLSVNSETKSEIVTYVRKYLRQDTPQAA